MRLGPACAFLAACAGAPTPAPAPAPGPPRAPVAAAPPSDAAPAACLPTAASSARVIDGDARAIHVCLGATCVEIARRTGTMTTWPTPAASPQQPSDVRVEDLDGYFWTCAGTHGCFATARDPTMGAHAISADASPFAIMVGIESARADDPPIFIVRPSNRRASTRIALATNDHCGEARVLDWMIFVVTHACASGPGTGSFFDLDGHLVATLSTADHPIDAYESQAIALGGSRWAIVAPWSYAVEVVDLPQLKHRDLVDLVPIQVSSTDHPSFAAALGADGALIVASPSGGVGVIDPHTLTLASSWIVPRCDSAATAP